jgi:hypothetical protein
MTDLLPPLLMPLLATLPAMAGVQISQAISSAKRRAPAPVPPRSASMRRLIKALKLHPLTISAEIKITGYDFPEMTVVRCLAKDEIDGIADWMTEERVDVCQLKPQATND